jgi:hypothetical protein
MAAWLVAVCLATTMGLASERSAQQTADGIAQAPGVRAGVCVLLGQTIHGGVGTFLYDNTRPINAMSVRYEWAVIGQPDAPSWRSTRAGLGVLYGNALAIDAERVYILDNLQHNQYGRGQKPLIAAFENRIVMPPADQKVDLPNLKRKQVWKNEDADLTLAFKGLAGGGERLYATRQPGGNVVGTPPPPDKGELLVYEAVSGKELSRLDLGAAPLFDGIAVAHGRTYVAMEDGSLQAFE